MSRPQVPSKLRPSRPIRSWSNASARLALLVAAAVHHFIMAVIEAIVVQSTFPDGETAEKVAKNLLESNLVACVNLIPSVRSLYRWRGEICDEIEVLAVIKTTASKFEAVCKLICTQHPYDCPEVIATPIVYGSSSYLKWMFAELVETP